MIYLVLGADLRTSDARDEGDVVGRGLCQRRVPQKEEGASVIHNARAFAKNMYAHD
jgi:hypothetical protein